MSIEVRCTRPSVRCTLVVKLGKLREIAKYSIVQGFMKPPKSVCIFAFLAENRLSWFSIAVRLV